MWDPRCNLRCIEVAKNPQKESLVKCQNVTRSEQILLEETCKRRQAWKMCNQGGNSNSSIGTHLQYRAACPIIIIIIIIRDTFHLIFTLKKAILHSITKLLIILCLTPKMGIIWAKCIRNNKMQSSFILLPFGVNITQLTSPN